MLQGLRYAALIAVVALLPGSAVGRGDSARAASGPGPDSGVDTARVSEPTWEELDRSPPLAPTALTGTLVGRRQVRIAWQYPWDPRVSSFCVYRHGPGRKPSVVTRVPYRAVGAPDSFAACSLTVRAPRPGTYTYVVTAVARVESDPSPEVRVVISNR